MAPDNVISLLPALVPWIPALAAPPAYILGRYSERLRNGLAVLACFTSFILTLAMVPPILKGQVLTYVLLSKDVSPLPIEFMADPLGVLVAAATTFAWFLATIYSVEYMKTEHAKNRFYFFWLLTAGVTFGVFLTKNLFALFI